MSFQYLESHETDGALVLTMTDPRTRNALGLQMAAELLGEIDRFNHSSELRVLVVTGADPAFCSGANVRDFEREIAERAEQAPPPVGSPWEQLDQAYHEALLGRRHSLGIREVIRVVSTVQKPTIAAVNGYAYGIGHGIALACDLRIASENARFCEAFVGMGIAAGDGSCWQLPRLIGTANTLYLQYTGESVGAEEALRIGLCNRVVPHGQLMEATMELAAKIAHGPTYAMALNKMLVLKGAQQTFVEHMWEADRALALSQASEDHKEGVRAFLEKRKPQFQGR